MRDLFNLVAIDPGNNVGIAIYTLSSVDLTIHNIETLTVVLNAQTNGLIDLGMERNLILEEVCSRLSTMYSPNVVAMETAFLNSRFPKAVMQLSQYTSTVERTFYKHNNFIKLYRYPPKYIKKYIGAGGAADKNDMTAAVSSISELSGKIDFNRVTEHEVDALAVGYITIEHLRTYPHELFCYS